MRELRAHGQEKRYVHSRIGMNARMDTLQAAVILGKLPHFDAETLRGSAWVLGTARRSATRKGPDHRLRKHPRLRTVYAAGPGSRGAPSRPRRGGHPHRRPLPARCTSSKPLKISVVRSVITPSRSEPAPRW